MPGTKLCKPNAQSRRQPRSGEGATIASHCPDNTYVVDRLNRPLNEPSESPGQVLFFGNRESIFRPAVAGGHPSGTKKSSLHMLAHDGELDCRGSRPSTDRGRLPIGWRAAWLSKPGRMWRDKKGHDEDV